MICNMKCSINKKYYFLLLILFFAGGFQKKQIKKPSFRQNLST